MKTIQVNDLIYRLNHHPLYDQLQNASSLCQFMESHVFCVWDFQSLLKALQRQLTCVDVPWLPTSDREARRLINEIVLDEESDEHPHGGYASHFELYLDAMREAGADCRQIQQLVWQLPHQKSIDDLCQSQEFPAGVAHFLRTTSAIIESNEMHLMAAAFTYGRELAIPDMFRQVVSQLSDQMPGEWALFQYYLERHIVCDGERHGPLAESLFVKACGNSQLRWEEAEACARQTLEARLTLWDSIQDSL